MVAVWYIRFQFCIDMLGKNFVVVEMKSNALVHMEEFIVNRFAEFGKFYLMVLIRLVNAIYILQFKL